MQESKVSLADPEVTLTQPRFGEEETLRARPVLPLNDGDAARGALNRGPEVALRAATWRSWPRASIVAAGLIVAVLALTAAALYQRSERANGSAYTQPSAAGIEEPNDTPQQTSRPQPRPEESIVSPAVDEDRAGSDAATHGRRTASREDDSDGDSDGRNRRWSRRGRLDDERMFRRVGRDRRVRRELRRLRDIFEDQQ